jgi:hypothetical protein
VNAVRPTVVGINCIDQGAVLPKIRLHNSKGANNKCKRRDKVGLHFLRKFSQKKRLNCIIIAFSLLFFFKII